MKREEKFKAFKDYLTTRTDILFFDESSFIGMRSKARFVDKDYGDFYATPSSVWHRNTGHKDRSREKIKATNLRKYGVEHTLQNKEVREKSKKTILERYGCDNIQKNEEIKNKTKQTFKDRYGDKRELVIAKARKTNLERYGVDNPNKCKEVRDKIDQTNLERYGVVNPFSNEELKEKIKKTNLDRYGYEMANKNEHIKSKTKETNISKYGVENPFANEDIKKKIVETNLLKYGVKYTCLNEEVAEKIKTTNKQRYGSEFPFASVQIQDKIKNKSMELYGVQSPLERADVIEKIRETCIKNYGVDNPFKSEIIKEKIKNTNKKKYGFTCALQNPEIKTKQMISAHKNLLSNHGSSLAELEIKEWVKSFGFEPKKHCSGAREIDIYIEKIKLGIEYNGLYWHSEAQKNKDYHILKKNLYTERGIRIVQIWEHWWINRKEQTKNFLMSILGKNIKIYARNTEIKQIDFSVAKSFINSNHIQKPKNSSILSVGIFFKGELISVANFSLHHRKNDKIVLDRFCCAPGYTIVGGLSKISKYASSLLKKDIYTWADLCISDGNGYLKSGWAIEKVIKPDYFYFSQNTKKVFSKQSRAKKKIKTPSGMTEAEHAKRDGLLRVYDCGKIRFIYKYKG